MPPSREDIEDFEFLNLAVLRGTCSSPAEVRVLPSGDTVVQLQLTTRSDGRAISVPVAVRKPAAWVESIDAGNRLVIVGTVRRRFFRAGGATASRVEVDAELVARAGDRRRASAARRKAEALLDALEDPFS
jgi:single-strand DNA-binding protein